MPKPCLNTPKPCARAALTTSRRPFHDEATLSRRPERRRRFRAATRRVGTEDIKRFAGEFDPQPFHLDEADAARSFFGGLAASGWHTAAVTMRLLVESPPIAGGGIGAGVGGVRRAKPGGARGLLA